MRNVDKEEEDCCVALMAIRLIQVELESVMDVTQSQAVCHQREGGIH